MKNSLIRKEYLGHSIPNKQTKLFFIVYIRGVCSKNIVPSNVIRHIKVHSKKNPNY